MWVEDPSSSALETFASTCFQKEPGPTANRRARDDVPQEELEGIGEMKF
jgi:hypothetical protein